MNHGDIFWILVFAIPITAIVMKSLERISRNRALERLAERGQPVPPEIFRERDENCGHPYGRNALRGGIIMVCIGIGIAIFFWAMTGANGLVNGPIEHDQNWLPFIGAIPFMVGVGLLLTAIFDRRPPAGKD